MNKKNIIIASLFFAVAIAAFFVVYKNDYFVPKKTNQIILFYSVNCSHCLKVESFLEVNKVAEKISFENKQLDNNSANTDELKQKANVCKLTGGIGIPFLWDGPDNKCIIGDEDVINFFSQKIASSTIAK
jgi:glutaredoxin